MRKVIHEEREIKAQEKMKADMQQAEPAAEPVLQDQPAEQQPVAQG